MATDNLPCLLTREQLDSDLAYLQANPTILDAFLTPTGGGGGPSITPPDLNEPTIKHVDLDVTLHLPLSDYPVTDSTPAQAVALARSFIHLARHEFLNVVKQEESGHGQIAKMGQELDRIQSGIQVLQEGLEGL